MLQNDGSAGDQKYGIPETGILRRGERGVSSSVSPSLQLGFGICWVFLNLCRMKFAELMTPTFLSISSRCWPAPAAVDFALGVVDRVTFADIFTIAASAVGLL